MDDLAIVIGADKANLVLDVCERKLAMYGHELNKHKCHGWSARSTKPDNFQGEWHTDGVIIAGVPIGPTSLAEACAEAIINETSTSAEKLLDLISYGAPGRPRVWSAGLLLESCLRPRMDHMARTVPPETLQPVAKKFDEMIQVTHKNIYQLGEHSLTSSVAQSSLSEARGGVGLTPLIDRLDAQFVGAAVLVCSTVRMATKIGFMTESRPALPCEDAIRRAVDRLVEQDVAKAPEWEEIVTPQKKWGVSVAAAIADLAKEQQLDEMTIEEGRRLESCSGRGAAWLRAKAATEDVSVDMFPTDEIEGPVLTRFDGSSLQVTDDAAIIMRHLRLGLPVGRRGKCGRKSLTADAARDECPEDCSTKHILTCPFGPWMRARHDRLARQLQLLILEIPGAEVEWVPHAPQWPKETGEPGEPDLLVRIPGWRDLYLDVTVVYPIAGVPGAAARKAECRKHRSYPAWAAGIRRTNCDFAPVAFETYGRIGPDTLQILRRLATRSAGERDCLETMEVRRWREILGLRLQLENANILRQA